MNPNYKQELTGEAEKLAQLTGPSRSPAQLCTRFVLDQLGVSTVLCGSKTLAHMEENARAADLSPLTAAEQEQLRQSGFSW
jgi:aryl-alcohol dehydrogenase-like predicted oxidoreductase